MTNTGIQAIDLRQGTLTATFCFTKIVSTFESAQTEYRSQESFESVAGYDAEGQHISKRAVITLKLTDDAVEKKRVMEIGLADTFKTITLRHATVNYPTNEETSHEVFRWNSFEDSMLKVTRVFGEESYMEVALPHNFEVFLEDSVGMWSKVGRFGVVGVVNEDHKPPRLEVKRFRDPENRDLSRNYATLVLAGLSFVSTGYSMTASTHEDAAWRFSPGTSETEQQMMGFFRPKVYSDEYSKDPAPTTSLCLHRAKLNPVLRVGSNNPLGIATAVAPFVQFVLSGGVTFFLEWILNFYRVDRSFLTSADLDQLMCDILAIHAYGNA